MPPILTDPELLARVDARFRERERICETAKNKLEHAHGAYLLTGGLLRCPSCGANFEVGQRARYYVCSSYRRRPGTCPNRLRLPIVETDNLILEQIEGEVLQPRIIEELLSLVEHSVDETSVLDGDHRRFKGEIDALVKSIAGRVDAPESIVNAIAERERQVKDIEARLRAGRPAQIDRDRLRAILQQRVETWRSDLRSETRIARAVLRRLVEFPMVMHTEPVPEHIQRLTDGMSENEAIAGLEDSPAFAAYRRAYDKLNRVTWKARVKPSALLEGVGVYIDKSRPRCSPMVTNVVTPPMTSARTVEPRARSWKNVSSTAGL